MLPRLGAEEILCSNVTNPGAPTSKYFCWLSLGVESVAFTFQKVPDMKSIRHPDQAKEPLVAFRYPVEPMPRPLLFWRNEQTLRFFSLFLHHFQVFSFNHWFDLDLGMLLKDNFGIEEQEEQVQQLTEHVRNFIATEEHQIFALTTKEGSQFRFLAASVLYLLRDRNPQHVEALEFNEFYQQHFPPKEFSFV